MRIGAASVLCLAFFVFGLSEVAHVADESFGAEFLGSPLLILVAVIVLAVLASLYHRIRK